MIKRFFTNPTCVSLSVLAIAIGCGGGDEGVNADGTTAGGGQGGIGTNGGATSGGGVTGGGLTSGGGVTNNGGFGTAGIGTGGRGAAGGPATGGAGPGAGGAGFGGRNFGGTFNGAGGNTTPPGPNCGDGNVDPGEDCDGQIQQGQTCATASMGTYTRGFLRCADNCTFDLGRCRMGGTGGGFEQGGQTGAAGAPDQGDGGPAP